MTATTWSDCPMIFVARPTCPCCGSPRSPIIIRSDQQGDGSTMRRCVCRDCSQRYKIVVEPVEVEPVMPLGESLPVFGSGEIGQW